MHVTHKTTSNLHFFLRITTSDSKNNTATEAKKKINAPMSSKYIRIFVTFKIRLWIHLLFQHENTGPPPFGQS